jgi:DNA-binding CsgD family transcriptional regulator
VAGSVGNREHPIRSGGGLMLVGESSTTKAPARLSAGERRVVDLVLEGLSNLEVAERLCLSKRTVDTHLGRVYRKLGIRGRPELASAVALC